MQDPLLQELRFQGAFDHLVDLIQDPPTGVAAQARINADRLKQIEYQLQFRPQFLPLVNTLPAAATTVPVPEFTYQGLTYDTIVTGAITDGEDRNIQFYYGTDVEYKLFKFGNDGDLKLSLDAIAGHNVNTAGYAGVKNWPLPMTLPANIPLLMSMYQDASPGYEFNVNTTFNGVRVYPKNSAESFLTGDARELVTNYINRTGTPTVRWATLKVEFDAAGQAIAKTPRYTNEVYSILGWRSTFTNAMVNLAFDGEFNAAWGTEKFPLWALAAEPGNPQKMWEMLPVPVFVPPKRQVVLSLSDHIVIDPADTSHDLYATGTNDTRFIECLLVTP